MGALATLQLHHIELRRARAEEAGVVDVGFDVRLVLVEVGDGDILPGTGHEREPDALLLRDHLAVGAEGGRAARLAGIERVAGRDVGPSRLICRIFAGGNDRHARNPAVRASSCTHGAEHQEQVLA